MLVSNAFASVKSRGAGLRTLPVRTFGLILVLRTTLGPLIVVVFLINFGASTLAPAPRVREEVEAGGVPFSLSIPTLERVLRGGAFEELVDVDGAVLLESALEDMRAAPG